MLAARVDSSTRPRRSRCARLRTARWATDISSVPTASFATKRSPGTASIGNGCSWLAGLSCRTRGQRRPPRNTASRYQVAGACVLDEHAVPLRKRCL